MMLHDVLPQYVNCDGSSHNNASPMLSGVIIADECCVDYCFLIMSAVLVLCYFKWCQWDDS